MPPDIATPDVALTAARAELDRLWARGTAFLGCRFAIMGGAMSWVSERHLVAAISNAGGFGVIACGSMGPDLLAAEIAGTQALTDKPFGVNLITMHPQLDDLIRVCLEAQVGHIVLAGGIPPGGAVRAVKDGGAKLICFTPALVLAKRLVRSGADALVIEGSRGRRAYRPGVADGAGAGDPAAHPRGAGVRRRRPGPRRGDPGVAGDGRVRRAARHAVRRRHESRSRIPTSSGRSSAPTRAMRCRRCSSTSGSR